MKVRRLRPEEFPAILDSDSLKDKSRYVGDGGFSVIYRWKKRNRNYDMYGDRYQIRIVAPDGNFKNTPYTRNTIKEARLLCKELISPAKKEENFSLYNQYGIEWIVADALVLASLDKRVINF